MKENWEEVRRDTQGRRQTTPPSPDTLAYTEDRVAVIVRKGQRRRDL